MDPWPLSEKVQKNLQMIVNYAPVPLPFRRYNWIHRDCKPILGYLHDLGPPHIFHGAVTLRRNGLSMDPGAAASESAFGEAAGDGLVFGGMGLK